MCGLCVCPRQEVVDSRRPSVTVAAATAVQQGSEPSPPRLPWQHPKTVTDHRSNSGKGETERERKERETGVCVHTPSVQPLQYQCLYKVGLCSPQHEDRSSRHVVEPTRASINRSYWVFNLAVQSQLNVCVGVCVRVWGCACAPVKRMRLCRRVQYLHNCIQRERQRW